VDVRGEGLQEGQGGWSGRLPGVDAWLPPRGGGGKGSLNFRSECNCGWRAFGIVQRGGACVRKGWFGGGGEGIRLLSCHRKGNCVGGKLTID